MSRITRPRLNLTFWAFYVLGASVLIAGLISNAIVVDILLILIVIAVGFHGLLEEYGAKENRRAAKRIEASINQLGEWMQRSHLFVKSVNERHESRLHNLDAKRGQLEQRLDRKSKELTTRMIYLENKYNALSKRLEAEEPKPLTSFERRVGEAVTALRKEGVMTTATYSRRTGISRRAATADLRKMAGMKIVRKRGKGRASFYVLAI